MGTLPQLVADNAIFGAGDAHPFAFGTITALLFLGHRILFATRTVPDIFADIGAVIQDARSLGRAPVYPALHPRAAARAGHAQAVQLCSDHAGAVAVGETLEYPPHPFGFVLVDHVFGAVVVALEIVSVGPARDDISARYLARQPAAGFVAHVVDILLIERAAHLARHFRLFVFAVAAVDHAQHADALPVEILHYLLLIDEIPSEAVEPFQYQNVELAIAGRLHHRGASEAMLDGRGAGYGFVLEYAGHARIVE
nr:hypothetical protein [Cupriavidus taiwanensis]